MKAHIDQLVIETTKRCNMYCEHCLRGNAENMDMSAKYLDELLSRTDWIGTVVFSGGEPSLAVPVMQKFYELSEQYECIPDSFYIVTNGKENQKKLAHSCLDAFAESCEKETCGLSVSRDRFHEETDGSIFDGLNFLTADKDLRAYEKKYPEWMIREGRAADNGMGREPDAYDGFSCELIPHWEWKPDKDPEMNISIELLYLSCNGYLYSDCNLSYDHMDEMTAETGIPCVPVCGNSKENWTELILKHPYKKQ